MLVIRTGLPGNGKTLNTIKEVDEKARAESRPVYYHNVAGLDPRKLQAEWYEFSEPVKWHELPQNSIVVVDEAQGSEAVPMFGVRDPRKAVPEHISAFETMRHRGHEVHLITQDPRFIDVHARRLCNKHIHYWRIFGSQKVSRYETERVVNDVEKLSAFVQSSRTVITLDKRFFGVYTSTQAGHHIKFRPSKKFVASALVILFAVVASFYVLDRITGDAPEPVAESESSPATFGAQVVSSAKGLLPGIVPKDAVAAVSPAQYVAQRAPRVDNLPASAPLYDGLTQPVAHPRLYCMSSTDPDVYARSWQRMPSGMVNGKQTVCQCYTQQGNRVKTDFRFCLDTVEYGYFDPTIADRGASKAADMVDQQSPQPIVAASDVPAGIHFGGVSPDKDARGMKLKP
ncbi:Zonular occludens toxin (Zot) [compost metagenome]